MIAAILVCCFNVVLPLMVLAMLPALMTVNRIVAVASGLERERRIEPAAVVAGGIVVAVVVVVVVRTQEKMVPCDSSRWPRQRNNSLPSENRK